jgi:hypothetical protein
LLPVVLASAAPRSLPSKENTMMDTLTLHELDESLFPELEREPGIYGIEPSLQRPGADPRIPAPKESRALLLVSYTLLMSQVPWGSRWELVAEGPESDSPRRRSTWRLVPPPPKEDNHRPLDPDPKLKPAPGALDRGVFWLDLSGPLREQRMRPGDTLTLRLAKSQAVLKLPAAPQR